jgi:hypothetical protein
MLCYCVSERLPVLAAQLGQLNGRPGLLMYLLKELKERLGIINVKVSRTPPLRRDANYLGAMKHQASGVLQGLASCPVLQCIGKCLFRPLDRALGSLERCTSRCGPQRRPYMGAS